MSDYQHKGVRPRPLKCSAVASVPPAHSAARGKATSRSTCSRARLLMQSTAAFWCLFEHVAMMSRRRMASKSARFQVFTSRQCVLELEANSQVVAKRHEGNRRLLGECWQGS